MSLSNAIAVALLLVPTQVYAVSNCEEWTRRVVSKAASEKDVAHESDVVRPTTDDDQTALHERVRNSDPWRVASMTESQRLGVIECLLSLEGSPEPGTPWGQTRPEVSQLFSQRTPASLSALYMISYVYTGNYRHADAVALRGDGAQGKSEHGLFYVTSPDAIARAYKSYHHWFDEVRRVGLASANAEGLDPLDGSGLSWY